MNLRTILMLSFVVFFLGNPNTIETKAAGKTYEGSGESNHCTLWATDRLRWPQTSVGREKQECRRRAVVPTSGVGFGVHILIKRLVKGCVYTNAVQLVRGI